jgi:diguanylate cyclase (GGDEF)-like protein
MRRLLTPGARRWLGAAAVLLLGLTVGGIVGLYAVKAEEVAADARAVEAASALANTIRTALEAVTAPADAVRAQIIAKDGAFNPDDLRTFALQLLNQSLEEGHALKSLSIAPDNVIEAVWPLEGNEAAIGLDLAATPAQWDPIKDRVAAGKSVLSGPINLIQGGRAFVYRTPVLLGDGTYWGLSSAVLDYSTVADPAKAAALKADVYILSRSLSGDVVDVFGSPEVPGQHVAIEEFAVPGSAWQVAVAPKPDSARVASTIGAVSIVLSCLIAALSYWIIELRQRSNKSLSRFMQIVETTPDFVAIFEVGGGLHHLNRAWRALVGLADHDPLPSNIESLFDGGALAQLREVAVPAALRDGRWSGESTLSAAGGQQLEVSLTVLRHEGPSGLDESRLTVVAHDITAYRNVERLTALTEELRRNLTVGADPIQCIQALGADALTLVRADGMVARMGREVFRLGDAPDQDAIDRQVRALSSAGTDLVRVTDCLAADMPELAASDTAGAIVARLPGTPDYLAWFRRPSATTVSRGGESTAPVGNDESGRPRPRASSEEFVENVHDRSRPWSDSDRTAAEGLHHAVQSGQLEYSYRQLAFEATIDPLTGLGNRRALAMTIDNETRSGSARQARPHLSLLFLDLDRFKQLNDAFGHTRGDLVLQSVAKRLERVTSEHVGRTGSVFRLGGDEFVVLLRDVTPEMVFRLAEEIVAAFRDPLNLGGSTHVVHFSVGAVVNGDDAVDGGDAVNADELLRRGDLAMYSAKSAGGSRVALYEDDFSHQAVRRLKLEQELYRALESDELIPAFQPIVSLRTGQIIGAEALARWRQPGTGALAPGEFIPLAEETGQIRQLDRQIAERAVARCAELLCDRKREFYLSINVSAKTIDAQYIGYLAELIERYAIPPERLTIELTESAVVGESGRLQQLLIDLRSLGVKVAIDDFGTGYSSLAYLQNLPADVVKLDRTFVDRLHGNPGADVVARWAIQLVSDLGMRIIAEGVETAEEEEALLSLGYDWVQGYRYGEPILEPPLPGDYKDSGNAPPG